MSEHTQDPQGEQPAIDAPEVPVSEQPQDTTALEAELENLDAAGLAKALGFEVSDEAPTDEEEAPETKPEETAPEEEPGEQPADEEEAEPEEPKPVNRRRLSVTGLPDEDRELTAKAIAMVRDGQAATIIEAITALSGAPASQKEPTDAFDEDPAPQPQAPPTLLELEARFDAASEELAESIREFDQDKQIALNKEIALLNRQILRAEQAEDSRKVEVSHYQNDYQAAVDEMETKYAELLDDENSPFADWLDDKVEAARARQDPALSDPRFIVEFADQIAKQVSRVPAAKAAPTPVPARPFKASGTAVAPAHKAKPQLTSRQAEEFIEKASADVLAAALWP